MALSKIDQVRLGIADFTAPYILSNDQVQHYLDLNELNVANTVEDLQPIVLATLAAKASANRIEEVWEDNTKAAPNYEKALQRVNQTKAANAVPVIGGADSAISLSIDMFDPNNDSTFTGEEDL